MAEPESLLDADFDAQLRGLFQEAEQAIEGRAAAARRAETEPETSEQKIEKKPDAATAAESAPGGKVSEALQPLVSGVEALTRKNEENTSLLKKLDESAAATIEVQKSLPELLALLKSAAEQRNSVSQQMFNALHQELKGYKDGFLLDSVHRPIIRDLITIYDDVAGIQRHMEDLAKEFTSIPGLTEHANTLLERVYSVQLHMKHHLEFVEEVLNRIDVTVMPSGGHGRLNKRTQRAVSVEVAKDPSEDAMVVRMVKRGFLWKERVVRPEEVVVKKWKADSAESVTSTES